MITEVSIYCQKNRRLVYGVYPRIPPIHHWFYILVQESPAVYDDGSTVWRCHCLDSPHEQKQWRGVVWNAVVRPGCKLKLTHFTLLRYAVLS